MPFSPSFTTTPHLALLNSTPASLSDLRQGAAMAKLLLPPPHTTQGFNLTVPFVIIATTISIPKSNASKKARGLYLTRMNEVRSGLPFFIEDLSVCYEERLLTQPIED
jgi:hypothetical protein